MRAMSALAPIVAFLVALCAARLLLTPAGRRIALFFSTIPFAGTVAPGKPSTPFIPARALGAPHTTCNGSPSPVSTVSTCNLSASGWRAAVST